MERGEGLTMRGCFAPETYKEMEIFIFIGWKKGNGSWGDRDCDIWWDEEEEERKSQQKVVIVKDIGFLQDCSMAMNEQGICQEGMLDALKKSENNN
ncbi:uncharacterized protein MONOS_15347 [Monocercomonoides exilis]|uniref:uncharacterized protein n=1 Tax=Monocercomonoides exilis TaxID=2049356 RepID=UPI00355A5924|nr:hypothetical protein MONOS_15347 [Monocercomonoides exilis]|eukprot:MONOS_15347.1-p1 / transcript=MONOS_15347.1 / gene=MONOS_15347 / organism=Monocercomonoides_exilis_PA203 / gene_product=unspecified product / transcript_product=unspecified product / location=Mono_scaffold01204:8471-8998(-) / protein_length=96 / sequence_SO=supercontig / SO=protein_coding / is_pseudo=false